MTRVWLCFDAHQPDGYVWAVRWGNTWLSAKDVDCQVRMQTHYRGPQAQQPRAYLAGHATSYNLCGNGTLRIQ